MNIIQEVNNMEAMVEIVHPLVDADPVPAPAQQADANLRRAPEENLEAMDHNALRRELARWDQMMRINQIQLKKRRINAILRPSLWSRLFNRNN